MRGNSHVRCGAGEKLEITSKAYLLLSGISDTIVKDFVFKEDNADTNKKHSQTYRNLKSNQEEIKEGNSSNSFDKIEKRENFIDDNFIDFKNSDENKSFSDETKNSSLIVTENAHSLKYEKTANKKI